jgi:hypothetical protein
VLGFAGDERGRSGPAIAGSSGALQRAGQTLGAETQEVASDSSSCYILAMNIPVRRADVELPPGLLQGGSVTSISGGAIFTLQTLRDLANSPDAAKQLADLAEALAEEENRFAMAILSKKVTGIDNLLIFIPVPGGQHGPRIKVAINPPDKPTGVQATVPFHAPSVGPIPDSLAGQVRTFIAANEAALLEYWNLSITTDEFISRLKPLR